MPVSLEVPRGEFFSLLGPSGCGKTTLLRMIAGFRSSRQRHDFHRRRSDEHVPPHLRPTNMVFQSVRDLSRICNVFDNIAYGLRKLKLPKDALRAKVDAMLATGAAGRSGWPRRRSIVGRPAPARGAGPAPWCANPKCLLLDEPLGALDKRLREADAIGTARPATQGRYHLCAGDSRPGRGLVAVRPGGGDGRRQDSCKSATPRALYERPPAAPWPTFIGEINFFHATVREIARDARP
jgi:spermidine/putrescine transport system ATP-binding protein/putrescine transport system ATP-binding protein